MSVREELLYNYVTGLKHRFTVAIEFSQYFTLVSILSSKFKIKVSKVDSVAYTACIYISQPVCHCPKAHTDIPINIQSC